MLKRKVLKKLRLKKRTLRRNTGRFLGTVPRKAY
jgi:hypothetical protein